MSAFLVTAGFDILKAAVVIIVINLFLDIRHGFVWSWRDVLIEVLCLISNAMMLTGYLMQGKVDITNALSTAFWAFMLWASVTDRGNRMRRKLRALGGKGLARLAAMKRRMAERKARPVLRPVPVRAGAWW
jgi:hypothetical protein